MFEKSTLSINIDLIFITFHFDLIGAATSCFASASGTTVHIIVTSLLAIVETYIYHGIPRFESLLYNIPSSAECQKVTCVSILAKTSRFSTMQHEHQNKNGQGHGNRQGHRHGHRKRRPRT
jgi:hypothetical protein